MGNTTIIELNHDWADEIKRHPMEFVQNILTQLRNGCSVPDEGKPIRGGRIISTFSRDDNDQYDCLWREYKNELAKYNKFLDDKLAEIHAKGFKL